MFNKKSQASQSPEAIARTKIRKLWKTGELFHCFNRFPARSDVPKVDRLKRVLEGGLLAPAADPEQKTQADLRYPIEGTEVPYDSVVFLHRFGQHSSLYTFSRPGFFTVIFDSALPVLTARDMGDNWPVLCLDEVYVKQKIPKEAFTGLVVHPSDFKPVWDELGLAIRNLSIPVYDVTGKVLWPQSQGWFRSV